MEKYLERPRHVEFQIMGDRHGHVIHLGGATAQSSAGIELIEEAPSPAVTPDLRERMGDAAVEAPRQSASSEPARWRCCSTRTAASTSWR